MTDERSAEALMERAIRLAERGRGLVEPNPLVGAVLVKDGKVVAEGYHRKFGGPHAEVDALLKLKDRSLARGATMFVTLEPCAAFEGKKTPPCVDALIAAKIAKLVVATEDPHPEVSGRSVRKLRKAGVEVSVGLLKEKARYQNAPYFKLIKTGFPFVTVKWAMSLDGKIATRTGDSKWISNERSREYVHELRGLNDAVVVGVNTVAADDPLLTPRLSRPRRQPLRVVVDSKGRIPLSSQIVKTAKEYPTFIAVTEACPERKIALLNRAGCEIGIFGGRKERVNLRALLLYFGQRRFTNILVEGGGTLIASFIEKKLYDRILAFIAPFLIGGRSAKTPVEGTGIPDIKNALKNRFHTIRRLDTDFLIQCDIEMDYLF
ncbi:MAG: bifunctional diaminohydroxyphosphoribosylaminopyrimidine deaminase/5-amino-6-(5-phosphoribosylamino)uracil reductase RibD [Planctomycetota bacterium]|nr:bifunctional diaminohydroxyphosphoribosylaminopyrimidine deaminase/5-amino-6-(5-phosphoribosylamino)uracil reductase RibD [Planctomycetota bacterium]